MAADDPDGPSADHHYECPLTRCGHGAGTANELCGHIVRQHQVNMFAWRQRLRSDGVTDEFEEELLDRLNE